MMTIPLSDFMLLAPEIFVLSMGCIILVVEAFVGERWRNISYTLSQLTLLLAALLSWNMLDTERVVVLGGPEDQRSRCQESVPEVRLLRIWVS